MSAHTLRFYENEGLLGPPARSPSGYRQYDESALERIRFIKTGKALGLRLSDIKELIEIREHGRCPCGHTTEVLDRRISEIEREVDGLIQLKDNLIAMKESSGDGRYRWCCPELKEEL